MRVSTITRRTWRVRSSKGTDASRPSIASTVVLAVSAATASAALLMKVADNQHRLLVTLSIWSAGLAGLGFLAAAMGKVADLRADPDRHRPGGPGVPDSGVGADLR